MKFTIKYTETYEMYYEVEAESEAAAIEQFHEDAENDMDFFHDIEMVDSSVEIYDAEEETEKVNHMISVSKNF